MDNHPSITVLLPVYLKSKSLTQIRLLRDALTSVADQKYPGDLEIIIIDDGSPFPIQEFADELGSGVALVRWLRLGNNQGIVGALNAGLAASRGELIGRIDADDFWLGGKLSAQVAQFREDPDLSISATGMVRVDTSGREIDRHIRPGDWKASCAFLWRSAVPSRMAAFWRTVVSTGHLADILTLVPCAIVKTMLYGVLGSASSSPLWLRKHTIPIVLAAVQSRPSLQSSRRQPHGR